MEMSELTNAPDELEAPDQPDGICAESVDDWRIPSPAKAAERVDAFVRWFGDGLVLDPGEDGAPLYARDLCALTCAVQHGYRADEPSRCLHQPPAALPRPDDHAPDVSDGTPDADGKTLPAGLCYVCQQPHQPRQDGDLREQIEEALCDYHAPITTTEREDYAATLNTLLRIAARPAPVVSGAVIADTVQAHFTDFDEERREAGCECGWLVKAHPDWQGEVRADHVGAMVTAALGLTVADEGRAWA